MMELHTLSNETFINQYAAPGLIGLVGGNALVDKTLRKIQGKIYNTPEGLWSHAFIFTEKRVDGYWWVLESDLDYGFKQMRLGVQENRSSKYFDQNLYPHLMIMDFRLSIQQTQEVLTKGLDLLSSGSKYSIREVLGTFLTVKSARLRKRENIFAQKRSFYCSAMVQHCYEAANINFQEQVSTKNITPYDIANTTIKHESYLLKRII